MAGRRLRSITLVRASRRWFRSSLPPFANGVKDGATRRLFVCRERGRMWLFGVRLYSLVAAIRWQEWVFTMSQTSRPG
jgi:hypothetical protein